MKPPAAGAGQVVRRWEAFVLTAEGVELLRRNRIGSAASGDGRLTWTPAYSRFDGALPLADMASLWSVRNKFMYVPSYSIARFQFDAAGEGEVLLNLNTADHVQAFFDGQPIEAADQMKLAVKPGRHTIVIVVDRDKRTEPLRCEIVDDANSKAAAVPVLTK